MERVGPLEEAQRKDVTTPTAGKKAEKLQGRVFAPTPNVKAKETSISKTSSSATPQVTNIIAPAEDVAKIERKMTVRAIEKGKGNVESKLEKKTPISSEMDKIRKKIFGGS